MKALFLALEATLMSSSQEIRGDEIVRLPINYKGSLNERSQEAIIVFRDWDTRACKPNAGKACWDPGADSYLQDMKEKLPTITRFFRERHSGPPPASPISRLGISSPPRRSRPETTSGSSPTAPAEDLSSLISVTTDPP